MVCVASSNLSRIVKIFIFRLKKQFLCISKIRQHIISFQIIFKKNKKKPIFVFFHLNIFCIIAVYFVPICYIKDSYLCFLKSNPNYPSCHATVLKDFTHLTSYKLRKNSSQRVHSFDFFRSQQKDYLSSAYFCSLSKSKKKTKKKL